MSFMNYTILSAFVSANIESLFSYMEQTGQTNKMPEILEKINTADLGDSKRVSIEPTSRNIKLVSEILDDPCLGLNVVDSFGVQNLPIFGTHAHFKKPEPGMNPIVMLTMIARYFRILTEVVSVSVSVSKQSLEVVLLPNSKSVSYHQSDGVMVAIHKIFTTGTHSKLKALHLTHAIPSIGDHRYEAVFGVRPQFDSEVVKMVYENTKRMDPEHIDYTKIIGINENYLEQNFPDLSFSQRCTEVIKQLLPVAEPKREHVSQVFHISVSTLKRRLKAEGQVFKDLVTEVRKELSETYIKQGDMSCAEIAFLLGYQNGSQFSQAFKTWYGASPTKYFKA